MDLHWYLYSKRKPVKGSLLKEVSLIKKMFDVKCSFAQQAMTMPAWSMPSIMVHRCLIASYHSVNGPFGHVLTIWLPDLSHNQMPTVFTSSSQSEVFVAWIICKKEILESQFKNDVTQIWTTLSHSNVCFTCSVSEVLTSLPYLRDIIYVTDCSRFRWGLLGGLILH